MRPTNLEHRWTLLLDRLRLRDTAGIGARLVARWTEPHRAYHTGAHLEQVLATLEAMDADPRAMLAAWFHDAVYDPRRHDNEARSAVLARTELAALGLPARDVDAVAAAVLATASHRDADPAFDALLDADLAILAAAPAEYAAYAAAIRREYAHVGDREFASGRLAFVSAMLARPRLFRTPYSHARLEAAARRNLELERARLCV